MQLVAIGVNELHDGSYTVDRTNYFGTYLLLMLKTPAMFCFDGEWMHIVAGSKEIERFGIELNTPLLIKDAEHTYTIFRIMKEEFACHGDQCTTVVSTLLDALLYKLTESRRSRTPGVAAKG